MTTAAALLGLVCLGALVFEVVRRGGGALNWSFFTQLPAPPGIEGGGLVNAILGTLLMVAAAAVLGIPVGVAAGIYLAEFGRESRFGLLVEFCLNTLLGIPSLLVGLCVFLTVVVPTRHFSGYAGAVTLALLMLPAVARVTADMLRMLPDDLREAVCSLGIPHWMATLTIFSRAIRSGLLTGILLAIGRVAGETAPLLLTALNSPYFLRSLNEPTANLTVTIFQYANSPYADWNRLAWGGALLILMIVTAINLLARILVKESPSL